MSKQKPIKVGVREGSGEPPFEYSVGILDCAFKEAEAALTPAQYQHMALQVKELARQSDPTHSETVDVKKVETFYEIRDSGGVLNGLNIRVFFGVDDGERWMIVIGVIKKQNNGKTPKGDKTRMSRRWRKYKSGDFGKLPL